MKAIKVSIISYLLLCCVISCNNNPSESENINGDFNFEITLKDANSNPLSDIEVIVWNKILRDIAFLPKRFSVNEIQASTSIRFNTPQTSFIELNVYDIENNLYQSLIKNKTLSAGYYTSIFHHHNDMGTGVYKCQIIARTDSLSNDILYKDSIYAVMIAPSTEFAKIGSTNQSGKFTTDRKVFFPSLYDLPDFIFTREDNPDSIGTFELTNEIIVALTNSSSETKYYEKTITKGENVLNLIWEEGSDEYPDWGQRAAFNKKGIYNKVQDDSTLIPNEYRLYQNHPNPFN